ncbi:hypothetical protein FUAX_10350 [Fulvitalea axinellae]|uniref:Uncharacterized protein n=1 Tax=Fulvitalea axinellae TaxID=1182444 RepID=A0AAU9CY85_9BACT|nr:hypothetical protein FUAX_10350 [Fulvitalea axinellae]
MKELGLSEYWLELWGRYLCIVCSVWAIIGILQPEDWRFE